MADSRTACQIWHGNSSRRQKGFTGPNPPGNTVAGSKVGLLLWRSCILTSALLVNILNTAAARLPIQLMISCSYSLRFEL